MRAPGQAAGLFMKVFPCRIPLLMTVVVRFSCSDENLDKKINPNKSRTNCGKEVGKRTGFAINVNSQPKTI